MFRLSEIKINKTAKAVIFWMVILFAALALWQVVKNSRGSERIPEISFSQFLSKTEAGDVLQVRISRVHATGLYRDGNSFQVILPPNQEQVLRMLQEKDVEIWYADTEQSTWGWLVNLLAPLLLLAGLWYFMIRQIRTRNLQPGSSVSGMSSNVGT